MTAVVVRLLVGWFRRRGPFHGSVRNPAWRIERATRCRRCHNPL